MATLFRFSKIFEVESGGILWVLKKKLLFITVKFADNQILN